MRREHLIALCSWIVPVLTTATTTLTLTTTTTTTTATATATATTACPCWSEIIQDIRASPETSKFAAGGLQLCDNPSLLVQRFEGCIIRQRCDSVDVSVQENWVRELCNADGNDIDLRRMGELRRRASENKQDNPPDNPPPPPPPPPTPTTDSSNPPPDTPKPNPKKGSSSSSNIPITTITKLKPSTTSGSSSTTTTSSSSKSSTTTTSSSSSSSSSSSTSTTTSTDTTSTPTSAPTAPAASATPSSSPSGSGMGPASIAAATIFSAFAVGCLAFLAFVCIRRAKRSRQKENVGEQLLSGAAKPGSGGSHRSISGSSGSIRDTESMFADRNQSVASIPLVDRQSGYAQRLYPLSDNAYHPAPQYEPRDAYHPDRDYGDLGRQPSAYSTYSPPYSASHSPAPEQFQSYRSPSAAYSASNQAWTAAPVAPIRNMRTGSVSSAHFNLPAALTPGDASGFTAGGYPSQYPAARG